MRERLLPIVEQVFGAGAAGVHEVSFDQDFQPLGVERQHVAHAAVLDGGCTLAWRARLVTGAGSHRHRIQQDHRAIAEVLEDAFRIVDIGNATRHAGCEIAPSLAQHHDNPAGHVLAAMVADAFNDGDGARIAHRKPLACNALEIGFASDRAVEHGVADDDVFGRLACRVLGLAYDHATAGEAFADIIVGVAHEIEGDAARQEGAEALPGRPGQSDVNRFIRQPGMTCLARDFT